LEEQRKLMARFAGAEAQLGSCSSERDGPSLLDRHLAAVTAKADFLAERVRILSTDNPRILGVVNDALLEEQRKLMGSFEGADAQLGSCHGEWDSLSMLDRQLAAVTAKADVLAERVRSLFITYPQALSPQHSAEGEAEAHGAVRGTSAAHQLPSAP
jgi:hypothetical protein